jgi:hypothetical protein
MESIKKSTRLLRTTKNGVEFSIYQQEALSFDISNSFITFSISTIECFRRQTLCYPHVSSRLPISDGYECIQIVATKSTFSTTKFLYWAESNEFVIGTAIVLEGTYLFPAFLHPKYSTFLENVQGTSLRFIML